MPSTFADYEPEKWKWITPFDVGYYPDHFPAALAHYTPTIDRFRLELAGNSRAHVLNISADGSADSTPE